MTYDPTGDKHRLMRDLLAELAVENPEKDYYYSTGSTVTTAAISAALQALRDYKANVGNIAERLRGIS